MRVLLFGTVWIALLAALAVAIGLPRSASVVATPQHVVVAPPPSLPRAGMRYPGWTVTRAYSAHHMMVVEVETDNVSISSRIAAQVVEPLKARYDEVLIYVREPGQRRGDLPARRVQWTPRAGYVESIYKPR
jgi:hypothetical protein